ncbi:MAG: PAS-domain containing protein, partial [Pseudomonadota bacterium]
MFDGYTIFALSLVYVGVLFAVAWAGDRYVGQRAGRTNDAADAGPSSASSDAARPIIYALSIAVYCTTWTFLGSVGTAATTGWGFIPVYLGPILMFVFGWPLIQRIVRIAKAQNITSIADFVAARYGKSANVAAVVTWVAVLGAVPYIALQLKAILITVETLQATGAGVAGLKAVEGTAGFWTGALVAACLATFAILFGTRHIEATEHQFGLILAISAESVVKLTAFLAVGLYATLYAFGGPAALWEALSNNPQIRNVFEQSPNGMYWITVTFLSLCCILLLPRQFHVTVVECRSEAEIRRASWLFPLYLVAINIFVVPIAAAGLMTFPSGSNPDLFVISLPMAAGESTITALAFVGGLSAATAMVVVEAIAISILICNGLVVPALVRTGLLESQSSADIGATLLTIRRAAIVLVVGLGFLFERALGTVGGLSAIGLIAFAAVAQMSPAFFLGLFWRGGTARGAIAGILSGGAVWAYTLLLPWIIKAGWLPMSLLTEGPFGLAFLKPQALMFLSFDPLTHGVLWSLLVNVVVFVTVSRAQQPEPVERMQSAFFTSRTIAQPPIATSGFKVWTEGVTRGDLKQIAARYLGAERAERSFTEFNHGRASPPPDHAEADLQTLQFTEHLLASAIGAASARLVLSLLLKREELGSSAAVQLLDDASEALQQNRDLLQSAIDQVRHGLVVFDRDLELICWNRRFRELLDLPPEFGRVGVPMERVLRALADRGDFGDGDRDQLVATRLRRLQLTQEKFQERLAGSGRYIEVRTAAMPQGGVVITFADITERVSVAQALAEINQTLERRVEERTAELLSLNAALALAKTRAEAANQDKTRFVAAATHDILQPLNAARLYATSLVERDLEPGNAQLARNVDLSLRAVEDIFGAIMEISRIDAGRIEPEMEPVAV